MGNIEHLDQFFTIATIVSAFWHTNNSNPWMFCSKQHVLERHIHEDHEDMTSSCWVTLRTICTPLHWTQVCRRDQPMLRSILSPDYIQARNILFFKFPSFTDRLLGDGLKRKEEEGVTMWKCRCVVVMTGLKVLLCTMWLMLRCVHILYRLKKMEVNIFLVMHCAVFRKSGYSKCTYYIDTVY